MKKNLLIATLLLAAGTASAQEAAAEYENVFEPHWYVGVQGGAQYTLGEVSFSDLLSPNAQLSVGYNFTPVLGARLGVNAWQSKGGLEGNYVSGPHNTKTIFKRDWKYNYVAPNIDLTINLSNLVCGFNPNRVLNVGMFVGVGANIAFGNDEAADVSAELLKLYPNWVNRKGQNMEYLWDGSRVSIQGRGGLYADFRVSSKVSVGIEANANVLDDHYNSKKAGNADWYFNALAGVKVALGDTHSRRAIPKPEPIIQEKIVEKIVEKVVEKEVPVRIETIRRDIFFNISSSSLQKMEQLKVREIAEFMKQHPDKKVAITGYADKGTGNANINMKLSERRAQIVVDELKRLGVPADRISVQEFKGDTEQPYAINELNRLSICVLE